MEGLIASREVGGNTEMSIGTTTLSSDSPHEYDEDQSNFAMPKVNSESVVTVWLGSDQAVITIVQMVLLVTLCISGACINSLVFWIFNRRPALRSLSNRFVLSLVTANVLISSLSSPLILFETALTSYLLLPCTPPIISAVSNSITFSAIFSTLLIATDRFYAVTSPLHYSMTITRIRSQVMIVVAWLSAIALSLPNLLLCLLPAGSEFQQGLNVFTMVLQGLIGYFLPFVGLCWLYLRMYHAAHRNSERTRKHSISGELLTVLDGTSSVIPQGIDFLTHYMNPFSKNPMAGSVIPTGPLSATGVVMVTKKPRRRSSNGSSSSLLFREEGRAIKTAFFVLASFFLCWTPHFALVLSSELNKSDPTQVRKNYKYGDWSNFFATAGMLLSSVLNPFIYVFRNKMACKELSKLLCGFIRSHRNHFKDNHGHNNNHLANGDGGGRMPHCRRYDSCGDYDPPPLHEPPTPLPKSPRRSSMKSLTPQSSLNSNSTQLHLNGASNDSSSSSANSPIMLIENGLQHPSVKPPFLRSLTLPEATQQPRVKFPANLTRQKSYVQRTVSGPAANQDAILHAQRHHHARPDPLLLSSPAQSRRSKFVRQDSVCSILSNDSVLMINEICLCGPHPQALQPHHFSSHLAQQPQRQASLRGERNPKCISSESSSEISPPLPGRYGSFRGHHDTRNDITHREKRGSFSAPFLRSYLRQDSNFSDKTTDSGVVSDFRTRSSTPTRRLSKTSSHFPVGPGGGVTQTFVFPSPDSTAPNSFEVHQGHEPGKDSIESTDCVKELPFLQTTI